MMYSRLKFCPQKSIHTGTCTCRFYEAQEIKGWGEGTSKQTILHQHGGMDIFQNNILCVMKDSN